MKFLSLHSYAILEVLDLGGAVHSVNAPVIASRQHLYMNEKGELIKIDLLRA